MKRKHIIAKSAGGIEVVIKTITAQNRQVLTLFQKTR